MNAPLDSLSDPATGRLRLRIAAINFLNPAPLMWDFEHQPHRSELATRYHLSLMSPAACAERLALPIEEPAAADIGLVPVAALATMPNLKIIPGTASQPGCVIASKRKVRSILLVRKASQPLSEIRTIAADTSSRSSLAYLQILFRKQWNPSATFVPHYPDLDPMLEAADAAMLIGDPALFALEERENLFARTGQELIYHDVAEEWIKLTGTPWVAAVWAIRDTSLQASNRSLEEIAQNFTASRDRGLANIETLVEEWSARIPLPANTIRAYLTSNIFYKLDEEVQSGLRKFYELAAEASVLPPYTF
ncbi:MAG TPA: menaquinone biosynthesis protein [Acidobacteriaceae bacterium]|nr:menaquinone biosynthesis protein [Acidobacteriaceae bacterium]